MKMKIEVVCLVHFREILENFNVKNFETILEKMLETWKQIKEYLFRNNKLETFLETMLSNSWNIIQ